MKHSLPFAVAIALVATSSAAQSGPVAQQSSEDLVCKLSGDCADADVAATRDKPDSRGFSIAKPRAAGQAANTQNQPARANVVEPRRSSVRTATPGRIAAARPAVSAPGRADLLITFISGSATLTEQAKANANQFIGALASPKLAGMRFAIEGHTDAVGSREYNLDLSQRRAQAVVSYLTANGVSRSRLDVQGYGFDRPLNAGNPRAASNRRVEVVKAN